MNADVLCSNRLLWHGCQHFSLIINFVHCNIKFEFKLWDEGLFNYCLFMYFCKQALIGSM